MVLLGSILNASYRSLLSERSDSKAIIACPAGLSKENGRSTIGKKNIGINIGLSDQLAVPDAAAFPEDRDQPSVGNTDSKGIARLSTGERVPVVAGLSELIGKPQHVVAIAFIWAMRNSNPRRPACKAGPWIDRNPFYSITLSLHTPLNRLPKFLRFSRDFRRFGAYSRRCRKILVALNRELSMDFKPKPRKSVRLVVHTEDHTPEALTIFNGTHGFHGLQG